METRNRDRAFRIHCDLDTSEDRILRMVDDRIDGFKVGC